MLVDFTKWLLVSEEHTIFLPFSQREIQIIHCIQRLNNNVFYKYMHLK